MTGEEIRNLIHDLNFAEEEAEGLFKLAPQPDFAGHPLRDVYEYHVRLREDDHSVHPLWFIVAVSGDYKNDGVLLVGLNTGDDKVGKVRCHLDEASLNGVNLDIANTGWYELLESEAREFREDNGAPYKALVRKEEAIRLEFQRPRPKWRYYGYSFEFIRWELAELVEPDYFDLAPSNRRIETYGRVGGWSVIHNRHAEMCKRAPLDGPVARARRESAGCYPHPNRCSEDVQHDPGFSCDEFPFASTAEADQGGQVNRCVPKKQNNQQGGKLTSYYNGKQNCNQNAPCTVIINPGNPGGNGVHYCKLWTPFLQWLDCSNSLDEPMFKGFSLDKDPPLPTDEELARPLNGGLFRLSNGMIVSRSTNVTLGTVAAVPVISSNKTFTHVFDVLDDDEVEFEEVSYVERIDDSHGFPNFTRPRNQKELLAMAPPVGSRPKKVV
ncbi:MAG: hypothetical protein M1831_000601 [Alyxoria varia]|nr:MAG: hypothetical protein M1831_000601 [Alyxoria varia]